MSAPMPPIPRFIVFEGADGVGKSTHADRLAERLNREWRLPVVRLHEPTSGPWGKKIRAAARSGQRPPAEEEADWFTRDREEDVRQNIAPALAAGAVVVLDRYFYSTAAYQGARGVPRESILRANRAFAPEPDLCIVLNCPPELAQQRISKRPGQADAFEALDYQRKVAHEFSLLVAEAAKTGACRMIEVPTTDAVGATESSVWRAVIGESVLGSFCAASWP